ncbi:hypothetical protein B0H14DRAFT_2648915 [Mycena olivaceomarginata]|nr:hypothetical protein B0H14DRAFT_2648915 [Mycena olivaceomarginata]
MDVDTQNMEDNDDSGGKCRYEEHEAAKVRMVPGPQREEYDKACDKQAFHKDQVLVAKQKSHKLTLENQQLLTQLEEAERTKAEHIAFLNSMNEELARKSQAIAELQQHEGQMEAQFLGDQEKLQALYDQCNTIVPQLLESQKLLMQRNEDVERLNRLLVQKQMRPFRCVPTATSKARTHLSVHHLLVAGHALVWILSATPAPALSKSHLTPILVTQVPSGKSKPKSKAKLAATPAFADLLGTDVATLSGLIGKLEQLLVGDEGDGGRQESNTEETEQAEVPGEQGPSEPYQSGPQSALRRSTYNKFDVEQAADFHIYNPAEPAKVAACKDGLADPADDLFQWDFSPGYTKCRWNDLMIAKVVDAVLEADGEDGEIAEGGVERDFLEALMREKLGRFRGAWKGFQPRFNERLGRLPLSSTSLLAEALLPNIAISQKFEDRVQTIIATIEIKTGEGNTGDVATWRRLLEMVQHLGQQGMSSEEEDEVQVDDTKVLIYKVKVCIWREPRVVEYLCFMDAQTGCSRSTNEVPPPLRESEVAPQGLLKLRVAFRRASTMVNG